jgi:hypothetical protein
VAAEQPTAFATRPLILRNGGAAVVIRSDEALSAVEDYGCAARRSRFYVRTTPRHRLEMPMTSDRTSAAVALQGLAAIALVFLAVAHDSARAEGATAGALAPEIVAKVRDFKQANSQYLKALCEGGSTAEREQTKAARDGLRDEIAKLISAGIDRSPEVQRTLDAATEASVSADRLGADPKASDQDKAAAKARFEKAKDQLRAAVAAETSRIELQIAKEIGVALAARDGCPDAVKNAQERRPDNPRTATRRNRTYRAASAPAERRATSAPAAAPSAPVGITFGGGGLGISIGH